MVATHRVVMVTLSACLRLPHRPFQAPSPHSSIGDEFNNLIFFSYINFGHFGCSSEKLHTDSYVCSLLKYDNCVIFHLRSRSTLQRRRPTAYGNSNRCTTSSLPMAPSLTTNHICMMTARGILVSSSLNLPVISSYLHSAL